MYSHKDGIVFRKMSREDLNKLLEMKDESWRGTHQTLISNQEDQIRWYESLPSTSLYMVGLNNDELLGVCGYTNISWVDRTCHISGSLLRFASKKGLAKHSWAGGLDFAFEILNMRRVEAEVLSCNYPAQKLDIEYLGMVVEGRKRASVYKSGRYYDSIILGLLRSEWESSERVKSYQGSCNLNFDHNIAERMLLRSGRYLHE